MVVATTVSPANFPRACKSRAVSSSTPSPFTTRPSPSQKKPDRHRRQTSRPDQTSRPTPPRPSLKSPDAAPRTLIDIFPVRRHMHKRRLNSQAPKQLRSLRRRRAIRAIHQHAQPAQVGRHARPPANRCKPCAAPLLPARVGLAIFTAVSSAARRLLPAAQKFLSQSPARARRSA